MDLRSSISLSPNLMEDRGTTDQTSTCQDMENFVKLLTTIRVYLHDWDVDKMNLTTVVSETKKMFAEVEAVVSEIEAASALPSSVKETMLGVGHRKLFRPLSQKVRATLLQGIYTFSCSCCFAHRPVGRICSFNLPGCACFSKVLLLLSGHLFVRGA